MFATPNELYQNIINDQKLDGSIQDPFLKAPLKSQYHYSAIMFASLCAKDKRGFETTLSFFEKNVFGNSVSIEFDTFFFSLIKKYFLETFVEFNLDRFIHFSSKDSLSHKNNNFRVMQFTSKVLLNEVFNREDELRWLNEIQAEDGLLFDTGKPGAGVPHLAYHYKCLAMLMIADLFIESKGLKNIIEKSLSASKRLIVADDFCYFGRSQNSLFSYGCLKLISKLSNNNLFTDIFNRNTDSFLNKNDLLKINMSYGNGREAYDGYMLDIVYNSYFCSLWFLGDLIHESKVYDANEKNELTTFKVFESEGYSEKYIVNIVNNADHKKYFLDPRCSLHSVLSWEKKGKRLLPPAAFYPKNLLSHVEKGRLYQKVKVVLHRLLNHSWLPAFGGNALIIKEKGIFSFLKSSKELLNDDFELTFGNKKGFLRRAPSDIKVKAHFKYKDTIDGHYKFEKEHVLYYTVRSFSKKYRLEESTLYTDCFSYTFFKAPFKIRVKECESSRERCFLFILYFRKTSEFTVVQKSL